MKKWTFFMVLIAILLFGSVIGFNLFKQQKIAEYMANRPEPEFPVTVTEVKAVDWVPVIEAIGFIEPNQGVTVANETSGVIDKISFESGTQVDTGQSLIHLDSDVEKANLQSSQARLISYIILSITVTTSSKFIVNRLWSISLDIFLDVHDIFQKMHSRSASG